nr:hypothetical protein [Bacteroidota bacterium]
MIFLAGLGAVAILLHARFRSPINIPGHHGIEFMALLLLGRMSSHLKMASSISSLGIGMLLLTPAFGFHNPFMGFNYMLPGLFLDLYFNLGEKLRRNILFLSVISGLAYLAVPLSRLIITASTGYPYGSFIKFGYFLPLFSYGAFGIAGGLLGSGISNIFTRLLSGFSKR